MMKKIASNIYVSTEMPGVNVGFIALPAGAIAIDAPALPQDAHMWREQILKIAGGSILYMVLTDAHPDRLLSAGMLGAPIVAARAAYDRALAYTDGFWRSIVDGWARRYPEAAEDLAEVSVVLPEIMLTDRLTLHKGGADVTIEKVAGGAPGSVWVYLQEQDVLFAGDTVVVETHPFMEATPDTKAWLETLSLLRRARYLDTTIVPGHGPVCKQEDTRSLSEYLAMVRRRMRSLQRTGRVRADRGSVVTELLPFFPTPEGEQDAVQRRIKAGLDRLCDEFRED